MLKNNRFLLPLRVLHTWCVLLVFAAMTGCGGGNHAPQTQTPQSSTTATIGTAGGTITHPDGIQVVIPAGALDGDTTIGIARNGAGAPTPLAGGQPAGSIYEFTPHDIVFNKPVLFRMPVPAGTTTETLLIASFGQGWESWEAVVNNGFAEWERNSFSWVGLNTPCASTNSNDPYPCARSSGRSFVTATPSNAITQLTGASGFQVVSFNGLSIRQAEFYAVDTAALTTVHVTMSYRGAPDCTNGRARIKKIIQGTGGTGGPAQLVTPPGEVTVPFDANARGTVTFDVPWDTGTTAKTIYSVQFSCDRPDYNPGGGYTTGGFDWITFIPSTPVVPGFSYGGTVTGLTASGLELQNGAREVLTVPAGSTSFTFLTRLASGAPYSVNVKTQPTGQNCTVQNGTSPVNVGITSDVSNITVTCTNVGTGGGATAVHHGKLSLGFRHTCALTSDDRLACWGSNSSLQIGQPNPQSASYPTPQIVPLAGTVTAVAAGQSETCAIHNGGQMSCWGSIGGTNIPTLQATAGTVSSIALSFAHRCFIAQGTVYCAGDNSWGQLGQGTTGVGSATPVSVPTALETGATPVALAGGTFHTCALSNTGQVRCWGRINSQSDASGNPVATSSPSMVAGLPAVVDIGAGNAHTCAVAADGGAWCWGANAAGQQGTGSTSAVFTTAATQVPGASGVIALGAGADQTCVVQGSGNVRCWGTGQMGNGNVTTTQPTPSLVSGLTGARTVAVASGQHVCVLTSARGAKCWGSNLQGQLGTSDLNARTTPTDVIGPLQYWWSP